VQDNSHTANNKIPDAGTVQDVENGFDLANHGEIPFSLLPARRPPHTYRVML
jgi:hypothetical protein